ncbi:I78 family peptidase inhibitor, partial [Pseudomonas aeruginosa]
PAADGRCDANAVQAYVGKQASAAIVEEARRAAGAEVARALRPHDAVTMDYNPRRLNIDVDDTLVIKRLSCG